MKASKKYSISEVADMLGVAPSTVSRALSGKKGVSEAQREKILKLAAEIGYQPNGMRLENAAKNEKVIGMILGDIRNPFYSKLVYHIQDFLKEQGYMVAVFNSEYDVRKEIQSLEMCEQFNAAGMILATAHSKEMEEKLSEEQLPMVLVNRILPGYSGDSVIVDNFQAGYMAAMHLIDYNHTRIGFICGPGSSSASSQRFEGFKQAMRNLNLPLDEAFIFHTDLRLESGRRAAGEFLAKPGPRPTAMIAGNDMTAIGFMDICRKNGVRIPEDLSIVSFDNIDFASVEGIQLSSIDHHVEEMSREVVRLLLKQIEGDRTHPERIIIAPELIIRGSSGRYNP